MIKRKNLFKSLVALLLFGFICANASSEEITSSEAITKLKQGNERFVSGNGVHPRLDGARRSQTFSGGQHPFATVITCSDSRVPVEAVFDQGIGDVFVIRVAGNVCDVDEVGSIEYGVDHLETPVFVVLGHRGCGAVTAVVNGAELHGSIPALVDNIRPAAVRAKATGQSGDALIATAVRENVWQSIEDLFSRSSAAAGRVKSGKLKVVGAVYDIESGSVEWLGEHPDQSALLSNASGGSHGTAVHASSSNHAASRIELVDRTELGHSGEQLAFAGLNVERESSGSTSYLIVIGVALLLAGAVFALWKLGLFKRMTVKNQLYVGFGVLVLLAVIIGLFNRFALEEVSRDGHLAEEMQSFALQAAEMRALQGEFLLVGIVDREKGEEHLAAHRRVSAELRNEMETIDNLDTDAQGVIDNVFKVLDAYDGSFGGLVENYHLIEEDKTLLDKEWEDVESRLESLVRNFEARLEAMRTSNASRAEVLDTAITLGVLAEIELYATRVAHAEVEFLLDKKIEHIDRIEVDFGELYAYIEKAKGRLTGDELDSLREVEREMHLYQEQLAEVVVAEFAVAAERERTEQEMAAIEEALTGLAHTMEAEADAAKESAEMAGLVGLGVSLLIGGGLAFFIAAGISRPISRAITELSSSSNEVSSASNLVAMASQQLAESSSEQASSLEEISSSLEEMSSMTQQNTANVHQARAFAGEAHTAAESGQEAMNNMVDAIDSIKASADETAKIVKTIDEIAFQTNLLALNAAVEAARAGEAGKGFAVVAEEVRNLAQRSAEAARTTAELIEGSKKNSDNGVSVSREVADRLSAIAESVSKANGLIIEIASASDEQATGIEQINLAVSNMDTTTQGNAASAEETSSASEELSAQAIQLDGIVRRLATLTGSTNGGNGTEHHKAVPAPKPVARLAPPREHAETLEVHEVLPEKVIPLDSKELAEF